MTRRTNARLAGFTFLFYIVVGITSLVISRATSADNPSERLALIAGHASQVRGTVLLSLVMCVTALLLAVALYGLTREVDGDLAVFALCCRVGEGMVGAFAPVVTLGLLALATGEGVTASPETGPASLSAFMLHLEDWTPIVAAILFAWGSTVFCWLFIRGRIVPLPLAWLGLLASILLVVSLPLQLIEVGPATQLIWVPMAAFEIPLGIWLLVKGGTLPDRVASPSHA
jgi:hypothetical protein